MKNLYTSTSAGPVANAKQAKYRNLLSELAAVPSVCLLFGAVATEQCKQL